jgi:hypothetical protein
VAAAPTVRDDLHAVRLCAGGHALRVVGYLRGPRPAGLDCLSPLRVVCKHCDYATAWACGGHRESRCRPCASRYRRRVRAVAHSGFAPARRPSGYLYLLTVTAPGAQQHSLPGGALCSCTPPGGVDLARWNASHSARWNRLRTAMRRDVPELQYFRGVEVQKRGALHDHAMVWSPVPLSKTRLRSLAMAAGFGHELDLADCVPGSKKAAYYVSKYVTKATDSRDLVPWIGQVIDYETGEVTEGLVPGRYRTWSMSREWGLTMRDVRAEASVYARAKEAARVAALDLAAFTALYAGGCLPPPGEGSWVLTAGGPP